MANRSSSSGARAPGATSRSAVRPTPRTTGASAGTSGPRAAGGSPRFESATARAAVVAGRLSALPRLAAARARDVGEGVRGGVQGVRDGVRDGVHSVRERLAARRSTNREEGEGGSGTDWRRVGAFGAGLAIGALLGAGTALLMAPTSGFETRVRLARGARRAGTRVADRFDDWSDAMRQTAHAGRTTIERKLTRGRWAAEDAWEARRREARERARARMYG
ncbi:YtxH domain-containing protein [Roseisolibacter agri]|uniref:YtxH-like protein n=1 Tax=Roseisolibacter agri TaxID=2014610 RepID=A0AA37QAH3_9BACT|nr:YtxH domain-containing protein [Roseisolibacter agri]GLC26086.1 hypothetical protein rosag_25990 [Roseisolibacter agri]